ncbi:hypothetical protein J7I80_04490 [Bacillus sp. ISL-41]|uniref:hypothetical protein n=1 Tax=Bacillus sp. ISL-41 TaxID=2819127 RepID=UPI001BE5F49A|nr:hypothetical protein [Bacillus sp. ISL-41]
MIATSNPITIEEAANTTNLLKEISLLLYAVKNTLFRLKTVIKIIIAENILAMITSIVQLLLKTLLLILQQNYPNIYSTLLLRLFNKEFNKKEWVNPV